MSSPRPSDEERRALLKRGNSMAGSSASSATATLSATLNRPSAPSSAPAADVTKPEATADVDKEKEGSGSMLIIAFVLMLFFQLGNRIFGRLQTYPMHNYPLFLNMVMVFVYIPICYAYIIPAMLFTNNITKEQREIPKYKFAVMGAYDSLAGIMQTFAVNYISNASVIVLVQQSAIPISMAISRYALGSTYTTAQYVGAGIVLGGIVVVLIPTFFSSPTATDAAAAAAAASTESSSEMLWILVLVVSCVPMCLSSVYKEKALGETEIDIMYLNGWVAIFQFLLALPLCLPSAYIQHLPASQIMPNIYAGMRCWAGINTITADNNPHQLPLDDCSSAPLYVTVYLFFNIVYNFLIIVILKLGSANIMWMASTVIVPLSNVAFSMQWMPGHQPLHFMDMVGLVVIMFGLVVYRFSSVLLPVYVYIMGGKVDEDLQHMQTRRAAEAHQLKYLGINQTEYMQALVETRVEKEQMMVLYRSPQQIRGNYLAKLGVPPSPLINMGGRGGRMPSIKGDGYMASPRMGASGAAGSLGRSGLAGAGSLGSGGYGSMQTKGKEGRALDV